MCIRAVNTLASVRFFSLLSIFQVGPWPFGVCVCGGGGGGPSDYTGEIGSPC